MPGSLSHSLRGAVLSLALAAAAVLLTAAPGPASAAEKSIWGPTTLPDGSSAFPLYRRLGVDSYQIQLNWASVAPNRPAAPRDPSDPGYRWPAELDRAVAAARGQRICVAVLVNGSPGWANGGRSSTHVPEPGAFDDFLTAASRRYRSVRRWMIFDERRRGDLVPVVGEHAVLRRRGLETRAESKQRERRVARRPEADMVERLELPGEREEDLPRCGAGTRREGVEGRRALRHWTTLPRIRVA